MNALLCTHFYTVHQHRAFVTGRHSAGGETGPTHTHIYVHYYCYRAYPYTYLRALLLFVYCINTKCVSIWRRQREIFAKNQE